MTTCSYFLNSLKSIRQVAAVAAAATLSIGASAATFTFNPSAIGLGAPGSGSFTADTLNVADFATVTNTPTGFVETGFLSITSASLGGTTLSATQAPGLNSSYGLYVAFTATGTQAYSGMAGSTLAYGGTINSLTYTFYGYNGVNSFSPSSNSAPSNSVVLGTGTLVPGTGFFDGKIDLAKNKVTSASASASLTFEPAAGASAFFVSPNASSFFSLAEATFSNVGSQIATQYTNNVISGFTVRDGGGSIAFVAAPVPEPETYAMLLAGLCVVGGLAARRKLKNQN